MKDGPRISIDLVTQSTPVTCECGGDIFKEACRFRKVSRLLTGAAKDSLVPLPTMVCVACGKVNDELSANIN